MLSLRNIPVLLALGSLPLIGGCNRSPRNFELPPGDALRGRAAFVSLGCHTCHRVFADPDLPKPVASPPVGVLGVGYKRSPSDAELVTSIINPSHALKTPYHDQKSADPSGKKSRMGDYTEAMTVRQLVDIIVYLGTRYELGADPDKSGAAPVGPLPEPEKDAPDEKSTPSPGEEP